ncbi:MAG: LamG-like jellyroll fold domain-containing protein [Nocardioidaceae bacterium]
MAPGAGLISRRAFIAGAGALLVGGCDLSQPQRQPTNTTPSTVTSGATTLASQPVETADLTVRWRHVQPRVEQVGLIAGWPFDEGSGYAFGDVSGHGNTLWITGSQWNTLGSGLTSAIHRPGRRGSGVYVDGTRWLQAQTNDSLAVGTALTVSLWLRPDSLPPSNGAALIEHGAAYRLGATHDGTVRFTMFDSGGAPHVVASRTATLTVGEWTHIAVAAAPTEGRLVLYVNGAQEAETTGQAFTAAASTQDLVVGCKVVGCLDEITLHDVALDQSAITQLYVVGLPKVYTQTRETVDPDRQIWTRFKGSEPIPHPTDAATVFTARFDGSSRSEQGAEPLGNAAAGYAPGIFGGALRAVGTPLSYRSPIRRDAGTFEAWYEAIRDPADPDRQRRKVLLVASGSRDVLTLYTHGGRWCVDVATSGVPAQVLIGPQQTFLPGTLEHVAVTWGRQDGASPVVALHVNGVEVARQTLVQGSPIFDDRIVLGGTVGTPAYCLIDDVRICDQPRSWGDICPRGQAATDAAGLDLRDSFNRPTGAAPMWWRPASDAARWSHQTKPGAASNATGADPAERQSLHQSVPTGLSALYHPDAFGQASSIEAGISFATAVDGWAGVFVLSPSPSSDFTGCSFAINPARRQLRIAQVGKGLIAAAKTLPYDFATGAATTYELTLTAAGDGVLRGFVDGNNMISMRVRADAATQGYAGPFTEGIAAYFDALHFTALTPATSTSRNIQTQVLSYGAGAGYAALELGPFRWHKRPGLPPWQYRTRDPEPPGNIAGAQTAVPQRPIAPAYWRSEDSANSDVITVDDRILCFLRGNARVDGVVSSGRIGVLHTTVDQFDGIHFSDPDRGNENLAAAMLLQGSLFNADVPTSSPGRFTLNSPASAYIGAGRLLFFAKEKRATMELVTDYRRLAYAYYDVRANQWMHSSASYVDWSAMDAADSRSHPSGIDGSPEVVSLRDPDDDAYTVVLYHQTMAGGRPVMAMTGLRPDDHGVPALDPGLPTVTSIGRPSHKSIYGFRVMFDNGIYYLHYNEGPNVPDWPDHFVLAAALDPYGGPWFVNPSTDGPHATYFRRGSEFEPDNGAIWQGTMFKHRGHYYLYYEDYHSTGDVDAPYRNYNDPQAGSRVGYATAL